MKKTRDHFSPAEEGRRRRKKTLSVSYLLLFSLDRSEMDSHDQLITLQFGTVSNWTGAHFWNLQVRHRERSFEVRVFGQGCIRSTMTTSDLLSPALFRRLSLSCRLTCPPPLRT